MTAERPVIVHAAEAFEGGVFHSIAHICNGLKDDFDFVVLHGWRPTTPNDFTNYFPANTRFIRWRVRQTASPGANMASIRQLKHLVDEIGAVRIHAHSSTAGVLARIACPTRSNFVVYSPRCYAFLRSDIRWPLRTGYAALEWLFGHLLPHITAACGYDELRQVHRMSRRATCIPNGIDIHAVDRATAGVQRATDITVVDAGRILPQKNFPLFCEVAASFHDRPWRFVWIGEGDVATALGGRGLPANVEITGWLSHADGLRRLAASNIFLHTALWEGLSRTCLEAAALRLPLLLPSVNGARELIRPENMTGYLCENADQFAARLDELAMNPALRECMGENARRFVAENYTSQAANRLWRELYLNGDPNMGGRAPADTD